VPDHELALQGSDLTGQGLKMSSQRKKGRPRNLRQAGITVVPQSRDHTHDLTRALRRDDPELGQMSPDGIEDHGALAHQEIAGPVQDKNALLFLGLDWNKTHVRSGDSLANRLGICSIILLAFDVGFHIGRWDKSHFMAKSRNLPRPVVRGCAGLHSD